MINLPFASGTKTKPLDLLIFNETTVQSWLKTQSPAIRKRAVQSGFGNAKGSLSLLLHDDSGAVNAVVLCLKMDNPQSAGAEAAQHLSTLFAQDALAKTLFDVTIKPALSLEDFSIGWALHAYRFSKFKKDAATTAPTLRWPQKVQPARVQSFIDAITLLRDLINMPSNLLGPQDLAASAKALAARHKAKFRLVADRDLLRENFPLVYTVGDASPRRPCLIDFTWGQLKHPKVTLVGKGVCFDTGGLNLKPGDNMRLMKKDMGGAAHVLALASLIMDAKLPVRLRVIIPAVENSLGGRAFRPGDILKSRKGLTIENTNTDAEGRLILADALAYACEDKPDFLIDCATLTGSARAALGPDIPALFSNRDAIAKDIQALSIKAHDPVWPMPLWQGYKRYLSSPIADLINSASVPGDLIYSALFLEHFVDTATPWVHLDLYAWENSGKPGRPIGGAECGLRALFAYLEKHYG